MSPGPDRQFGSRFPEGGAPTPNTVREPLGAAGAAAGGGGAGCAGEAAGDGPPAGCGGAAAGCGCA
ncbi:MAG: hypothetical protein D6689_22090 [Deltaproteobacteria bacterium]|nr:MAG: hypothetical protein D6689_22090 [Deltaproteobacteria bacterium]